MLFYIGGSGVTIAVFLGLASRQQLIGSEVICEYGSGLCVYSHWVLIPSMAIMVIGLLMNMERSGRRSCSQ